MANISERLDRVLVNLKWHLKYPNSAVFHLPRFSSDHLPVLLKPVAEVKRKNTLFRTENWWALDEQFNKICDDLKPTQGSDWKKLTGIFKGKVRIWLRERRTPNKILTEIESEMEQLLKQDPSTVSQEEEDEVQHRHRRCLVMNEEYWRQRASINWMVVGDNNTRFFHAMAVTRKRRNQINALLVNGDHWETCPKKITGLFVAHYRAIYTKQATRDIHEVFPAQLLARLPKVPVIVGPSLESMPSDQEIKEAVMGLGPDKAPGPDGFHARLIQEKWEVFGPSVLTEVRQFFITGHMKQEIAKTNLILIPKREDANKVEQFRPVSVCNVIYKIISKILTARLKPFIGDCIFASQAAFVPGRDIAENVIMLREILHSFGQSSYKRAEFCLKVDLSKAFDRLDWDFLQSILPLYGIPIRMVNWIMECVRSACFTVVLNGSGQGFFRPSCGLRQGCSLSPYLFILGMDILARALDDSAKNGHLQGVRIAQQAPPLTSCIYADDLLLLGAATQSEANTILSTLSDFAAVSGQRIGPEKSFIWYSKAVPDTVQNLISVILGVPNEATSDMYLGAPIQTNKAAFDFLIERVSGKLQVWKARLLSQAGRLVLIKSVLLSMPVYYMSTTMIPTSVINAINSLVRRFFWGAGDKARYLAYISWDSITLPREVGGLGVRDLKVVNQAMLLKSLWKLASGASPLWIKIVKAKYLPRSKLWTSKRVYNCTIFWKSIMAVRELLMQMLRWQLGDGQCCEVFAQPWIPNCNVIQVPNSNNRDLKVASLVEPDLSTWDMERLISLFGMQTCMQIISHVAPPNPESGEDRLIFTPAPNGCFTVKGAYQQITGGRSISPIGTPELWNCIWKKGRVVPKVRLFIWKVVRNGLPLNKTIASRTSRGEPECASCCQNDEDSTHLLFTCPFARSCWYASPLPIRSDSLPTDDTASTALLNLSSLLKNEDWGVALNICWAIWRCRNDKAYAGIAPTHQQFTKYLNSISSETTIALSGTKCQSQSQRVRYVHQASGFSCKVDGSWIHSWCGGLGFVLTEGEELRVAKSKGTKACCSIQAEAMALLEVVRYVVGTGVSECKFYTDNESLANLSMALQPPMQADWRAFKEIMEIWRAFKQNNHFSCQYFPRCHNEMADKLAKEGSKQNWDFEAFTYPILHFGN